MQGLFSINVLNIFRLVFKELRSEGLVGASPSLQSMFELMIKSFHLYFFQQMKNRMRKCILEAVIPPPQVLPVSALIMQESLTKGNQKTLRLILVK
jgi:hypothetical protein